MLKVELAIQRFPDGLIIKAIPQDVDEKTGEVIAEITDCKIEWFGGATTINIDPSICFAKGTDDVIVEVTLPDGTYETVTWHREAQVEQMRAAAAAYGFRTGV